MTETKGRGRPAKWKDSTERQRAFYARQRARTPLQKALGLPAGMEGYTAAEARILVELKDAMEEAERLAEELHGMVGARLEAEGQEEPLEALRKGFTRLQLPNY